MKYAKNLWLPASLALLFFVGRCTARSDGKDAQKSVELQAKATAAEKSAKAWKDSATAEKKRGDSLARGYVQAKIVYRTKRDSILVTPNTSGLVPIEQLQDVLQSADSALAEADSVIASKDRRIGFLENSLSDREKQIAFLNSRISVEVRRRKRGRFEGALVGVAAAGFVYLGSVASK